MAPRCQTIINDQMAPRVLCVNELALRSSVAGLDSVQHCPLYKLTRQHRVLMICWYNNCDLW